MTNIKNTKRQFDAWMIALILSFLPLIFWLAAPTYAGRFSDKFQILKSFGQATALVGVAMFAVNLIISARLKIFDAWFGGLNRMYNKHNLLGQIALVLLLIHPLLLIPSYASSYASAATFLLPLGTWEKSAGIFALVIMIVLIVLTLYLRPKYNLWKITHKFFGFAFFLGAIHMFFIPSDVSRFLPLKIYMLALSGSAVAVFIYRSLFGRILVRKYSYTVSAVNKLNAATTELVMSPDNQAMNFKAGQFAFLTLHDKSISSEAHPFSMTSSENDKSLTFIVKKLGDYTSQISKISVGSKVEIEGPYGIFNVDQAESKKQIWIAGGVGITPFISMAASLPRNNGYDVHLIYSVKNENEAIKMNELNTHPNITTELFIAEKKGLINAEMVDQMADGLIGKDIFICAPPGMIKALKSQFTEKNIPKNVIHSEEFNF